MIIIVVCCVFIIQDYKRTKQKAAILTDRRIEGQTNNHLYSSFATKIKFKLLEWGMDRKGKKVFNDSQCSNEN